jgi:hypothetical protein
MIRIARTIHKEFQAWFRSTRGHPLKGPCQEEKPILGKGDVVDKRKKFKKEDERDT